MVANHDKTAWWTALAVLAVLPWCAAAAGNDSAGEAEKAAAGGRAYSRWSSVVAVRFGKAPQRGLVEFELPAEAISAARGDLRDLRLTDGQGRLTPHITRTDRGQTGEPNVYEPLSTGDPAHVRGERTTVTVDFGAPATRTAVDIVTPGSDFCRRVTVEASPDGQSWRVIRESGWLYSVSHENGRYAKSRVKLPENDYQYLRVTVFNAPGDPAELPVESVRGVCARGADAPKVDVPVPPGAVSVAENPRFNATEVDIDLGLAHLPLCQVHLACEDERFMRRVEVLGRDRKTLTVTQIQKDGPPRNRQVDAPWRSLGGAVVHRFGKLESDLTVPLTDGCRYLKVRIYNRDDSPLKLVKNSLGVRRLRQYVAFQAKGPGPCTLYLGNEKAPAPQYDLPHFADRLRAEGVTAATLGPVEANPFFEPPPKEPTWADEHRGLTWAAMIFLSLVLIAMVVRQLRKRPTGRRSRL